MEIVVGRAGPADEAAIAELFREADLLHHRGVPAAFGVPTEPVRPASSKRSSPTPSKS